MTPTCPTCKEPMSRGVEIRWRCERHGPADPGVLSFAIPSQGAFSSKYRRAFGPFFDHGLESWRLPNMPPDPDLPTLATSTKLHDLTLEFMRAQYAERERELANFVANEFAMSRAGDETEADFHARIAQHVREWKASCPAEFEAQAAQWAADAPWLFEPVGAGWAADAMLRALG